MTDKTAALEKEQDDVAKVKAHDAHDDAIAKNRGEVRASEVRAKTAPAPTTPSPQPSTDPAAYWPDDQPHYNEEPPRDQVYPPTDRQANQDQVAVPETYRTPTGYLVTKHPAATAMVHKQAVVTDAHRNLQAGLGIQTPPPRKVAAPIPTGDIEAQMKSKHDEIRDLEQSLSDARHDLDGMLRVKNFPTTKVG